MLLGRRHTILRCQPACGVTWQVCWSAGIRILQACHSPVPWTWDATGPFTQQQQTKLCTFHPNLFSSCLPSSLEQLRYSIGNLLSTLGLSLWSQHYFPLLVWAKNEQQDFCFQTEETRVRLFILAEESTTVTKHHKGVIEVTEKEL